MNSSSVAHDLSAPGAVVEGLQLVELLLREVHARPLDVVVARHPADGRFAAHGAAAGSVHDPLQNPHVFAEARPDELPLASLRNQ